MYLVFIEQFGIKSSYTYSYILYIPSRRVVIQYTNCIKHCNHTPNAINCDQEMHRLQSIIFIPKISRNRHKLDACFRHRRRVHFIRTGHVPTKPINRNHMVISALYTMLQRKLIYRAISCIYWKPYSFWCSLTFGWAFLDNSNVRSHTLVRKHHFSSLHILTVKHKHSYRIYEKNKEVVKLHSIALKLFLTNHQAHLKWITSSIQLNPQSKSNKHVFWM